jgi:hypothetical protein
MQPTKSPKLTVQGDPEITRWTAADGVPEKVGAYFGIGRLAVNEAQLAKATIFRLKNWTGPLIINEEVKQLLQSHKTTGIVFNELDAF